MAEEEKKDEGGLQRSATMRASVIAMEGWKGYLNKKGGVWGNSWQSRYFTITGSVLTYYERKGGRRRGQLVLPGCVVTEEPSNNRDFKVSGQHLRHSYVLQAASEKERAAWIDSMKHAGAIIAGETSLQQQLQAALRDSSGMNFNSFLQKLYHPNATPILQELRAFIAQIKKATTSTADDTTTTTPADNTPPDTTTTTTTTTGTTSRTTVDEDNLPDTIRTFLLAVHEEVCSNVMWKSLEEDDQDQLVDALEQYTMLKLHKYLFPSTPTNEDVQLAARLTAFDFVGADHMEVDPKITQHASWAAAKKELASIHRRATPRDKLCCVTRTCRLLGEAIDCVKQDYAADDFLPCMILLVLQAKPYRFATNLQFVENYRNPFVLAQEAGYFFRSMQSTELFWRTCSREMLNISEAQYDGVQSKIQELTQTLKDDWNSFFKDEEAFASDSPTVPAAGDRESWGAGSLGSSYSYAKLLKHNSDLSSSAGSFTKGHQQRFSVSSEGSDGGGGGCGPPSSSCYYSSSLAMALANYVAKLDDTDEEITHMAQVVAAHLVWLDDAAAFKETTSPSSSSSTTTTEALKELTTTVQTIQDAYNQQQQPASPQQQAPTTVADATTTATTTPGNNNKEENENNGSNTGPSEPKANTEKEPAALQQKAPPTTTTTTTTTTTSVTTPTTASTTTEQQQEQEQEQDNPTGSDEQPTTEDKPKPNINKQEEKTATKLEEVEIQDEQSDGDDESEEEEGGFEMQ